MFNLEFRKNPRSVKIDFFLLQVHWALGCAMEDEVHRMEEPFFYLRVLNSLCLYVCTSILAKPQPPWDLH